MTITKNCRYILANGTYCEKHVRYRMATDDSGNKYRKYATFCTEHLAMIDDNDDEIE